MRVHIQGISNRDALRKDLVEYIIIGVLIGMSVKDIKNFVKTIIRKRSLQSATFKEMVNWLHELEFLIIKVMMFIIVIHHLYTYTMKAVF